MPLSITSSLRMDATSATFFGLPELVRQRLDQGDAPGRANTGDKMMTLVASALAGGEAQPQGHVGLAGAAVAGGDNERSPPAAWTQSPGAEERPRGISRPPT